MTLKNLKIFLASLAAVFTVGLIGLPAVAPAYADDLKGAACGGLNTFEGNSAGNDCSTTAAGADKVNSLVHDIVNFLSWIVGITAVIALIIAGFKYITSGGSSEKISSAKSALLYAIVGIVIVALAQFIVYFAFNTAKAGGVCQYNPGLPANSSDCKKP